MAKQLNLYGLSARVILFFARNPEEELTRSDIALKFDVRPEDVRPMLRRALEDGAVQQLVRGGGAKEAVYAAGPQLLEVLGLAALACVPVRSLGTAVEKR